MRRIKRVNHKRKTQLYQRHHQVNKKKHKLSQLLERTRHFQTEKDLHQSLRRGNNRLRQKATKTKLIYQI